MEDWDIPSVTGAPALVRTKTPQNLSTVEPQLFLVTTVTYTFWLKGKALTQSNTLVIRNFSTVNHIWPQMRFD